MIEVCDIVKRYGATVAVDHVSFRVDQGEIVGFLGPNGAGKSTTLKIVTCYIVADSGIVSVDGMDALENSLEVRRRIGYLPENTPLYPDMQVGEFLEFVGKGRQLSAPERRDAIDRVVGLVGIERMMRKRISYLSKGYRQRVGVAQALIHDPPILIMDEPTSGLDPHQIIEIRDLIRELGKTKVIILSSHILQEMSAVATRILIIRDGRIVADASPAELQEDVRDARVFQCRLRGPVEEVAKKLEEIDVVRTLEPVGPVNGLNSYRLTTGAEVDENQVGEKVFRVAADHGWSLTSFGKEERSLEDVYLEKTEIGRADRDEERVILAGRATRLLAYLFDRVIGIPFIFPAFLVLLVSGSLTAHWITSGVGMLAYHVLQWILLAKDGQTVGKKILAVRIVRHADGGNPGFGRAVGLRWILNYWVFYNVPTLVPAVFPITALAVFPLLGLIYFLVDSLLIVGDERRCVHDYLAGTKVIEVRTSPGREPRIQTLASAGSAV